MPNMFDFARDSMRECSRIGFKSGPPCRFGSKHVREYAASSTHSEGKWAIVVERHGLTCHHLLTNTIRHTVLCGQPGRSDGTKKSITTNPDGGTYFPIIHSREGTSFPDACMYLPTHAPHGIQGLRLVPWIWPSPQRMIANHSGTFGLRFGGY